MLMGIKTKLVMWPIFEMIMPYLKIMAFLALFLKQKLKIKKMSPFLSFWNVYWKKSYRMGQSKYSYSKSNKKDEFTIPKLSWNNNDSPSNFRWYFSYKLYIRWRHKEWVEMLSQKPKKKKKNEISLNISCHNLNLLMKFALNHSCLYWVDKLIYTLFGNPVFRASKNPPHLKDCCSTIFVYKFSFRL